MVNDSLARRPRAVLFDLDGTLADTAPDLAAAVNKLRTDRDLEAAPYAELRPFASAGARGLIGAAFDIAPADPRYDGLRDEFLANYISSIAVHSTLFDGVVPMLAELVNNGIGWGIVTNKAAYLTEQLVPLIGLASAGCIVSGDTTPYPKPHPAPLIEAARRLGVPAEACWYVGDDRRDIEAGRAAGMPTIAAAWGYCGSSEPHTWNADLILEKPLDLLQTLLRCKL